MKNINKQKGNISKEEEILIIVNKLCHIILKIKIINYLKINL